MHWSEQYLNIPWLWRGETRDGIDCLGLIKLVLSEQKKLIIPEYSPNDIDSKYSMVERAIKYGTLIKNIKDLREFNVVFFTIHNEVNHMGIMVNKFGKFLHQLENKTSRTSDVNNEYWNRRFFIGIHING